MNRPIILHSEAEDDIFEVVAWYRERSRLAARAFVQELTHVVRLAAQSPGTWPIVFGTTRRVVCPRFPFDLVFRTRGEAVEIVALAHHRRRPDYWYNR